MSDQYRGGRRPLMNAGAILAGLLAHLLGFAAVAAPGDIRILRSFAAPHASPDGITTDGQWLYISDCQSDTLAIVSPVDGAVVGTRRLPGFMIDHVSWAEGALWLNDHDRHSVIAQVDPTDGTVLRQFDMPFDNVMGVAWDGLRLWTMDATRGKVLTVDPETGLATERFPTPANNPCGIAWDGQCLWVGDLTTKRFYLLDPADGAVQADFRIPGPATALPTGILWDGDHGWVMDEYPKAPIVYELEVEFPSSGPCGRPSEESGAEDLATDPGREPDLVPDDVESPDPGVAEAHDAFAETADPPVDDRPPDDAAPDVLPARPKRSSGCAAGNPERTAALPCLALPSAAWVALRVRRRLVASRRGPAKATPAGTEVWR